MYFVWILKLGCQENFNEVFCFIIILSQCRTYAFLQIAEAFLVVEPCTCFDIPELPVQHVRDDPSRQVSID